MSIEPSMSDYSHRDAVVNDCHPSEASIRTAIVGTVIMGGFLTVLLWLTRRGWRLSIIAAASRDSQPIVYALVVAMGLGCAIAPPSWRRRMQLVASLAGYPLVLGVWAVPLVAYAVFVCLLARTRLSVLRQVTIAFLVWCVPPAVRAFVIAAPGQQVFVLGVLWAGVIYSALFVVIERSRCPDEASMTDDLFYFLALPRLAEPFFQPIGGRYLRQQEVGRPSWRLIASGLALGCYGVLLALVVHVLTGPMPALSPPARLARDFVVYYTTVTNQIFVAIAMFRLLGFDLSSGYRRPFLSRSFAEFFRRYNHYVRDAVKSLFYYPFLGVLRHRLPRRAALIASSLGAIFIGSYLLNDLLVPVVTAADMRAGLRKAASPTHLAILACYWCLIVVPPLLAPRRGGDRPWPVQIARITMFNAMFFVVWLYLGGHHHHGGMR